MAASDRGVGGLNNAERHLEISTSRNFDPSMNVIILTNRTFRERFSEMGQFNVTNSCSNRHREKKPRYHMQRGRF